MNDSKAPTKASDIAWDVTKNELIKKIREKDSHHTTFSGALGESNAYFDKNEARIDRIIDKLNDGTCNTRSKEIAIMLKESISLADFILIHEVITLTRVREELKRDLLKTFKSSLTH